jgi:hypothetical protein
MKAEDAARLVNSLAFHPDYRITATATSYTGSEYVYVEIDQRTYDSSEIDASGRYYQRATVGPVSGFQSDGLDADGVIFEVLRCLQVHHDHEAREFLRAYRNGRWTAPFHPHNDDGKRNYERRGGRAA